MTRISRTLLLAQAVVAVASVSANGNATVLAAPVGRTAIPIPEGLSLCGNPGSGWQLDATGTRVRPPSDPTQIGKAVQVRAASTPEGCTSSKTAVSLVPSGVIPSIDRRLVDLWIDEGRVEVRGTQLDGIRLDWETSGEKGIDDCIAPSGPTEKQSCSFSVSKKFPANFSGSTLRVLPAGVPAGADVFDQTGQPVPREALALQPARVIISSSLTMETHVDLSTGEGQVVLSHPEAVANVDCDSGRCELSEGRVRVRGILSSARTIALKLWLNPHVYLRSGDGFVQNAIVPLEITYCPMVVVSSPPLRDTDDVRVVVRTDGRCGGSNGIFRWSSNGNPVPALDTETRDGFVYTLLGIGRVSSERITLTASRSGLDAAIIGQTSVATEPSPHPQVVR